MYKSREEINMELLYKELKIAILAGERSFCSVLETLLETISENLYMHLNIEPWYSGETLCNYLKKGNRFNVIFLEIELDCLNGIDVGRFIRDDLEDTETQIIYVSSKRNHAMQLFDTQPFSFLLKPLNPSDLSTVMRKLLKVIAIQNHFFEYQAGREIFKIPYNEIIYFKSDLHKIVIISKKQELYFYGKLKEIITLLPVNFLSIHNSFIINKNYVSRYSLKYVVMSNNHILSISKKYQKIMQKKYMSTDNA